MSQKLHSPLGPSKLEQRRLCPGSLHLEKDLPEVSTDASQYGNVMHQACAELCKYKDIADSNVVLEVNNKLDNTSQKALAFVKDFLAEKIWKHFHGNDLIEEELDLKFISPLVEKGTVDYGNVKEYDEGCLVDWKFGSLNIPMGADNLQLMAYALGLNHRYMCLPIHAYIVHPLQQHVSYVKVTANELTHSAARIAEIIEKCSQTNAPLNAGPSQCKYCKALTTCPAAQGNLADIAGSFAWPDTPQLRGIMMNKILVVRNLLDKQQEKLFNEMEAGKGVTGYKLSKPRTKDDGTPRKRYIIKDTL